MLLRCDNRIRIELPDLISMRLEDEGMASPCWPLILIKTNQVGKTDQVAAFRHRNPLMCPQGAVAWYLFWRW
jgi:Centromere DNA-binding protein complex CBF3 subunit, domain 2